MQDTEEKEWSNRGMIVAPDQNGLYVMAQTRWMLADNMRVISIRTRGQKMSVDPRQDLYQRFFNDLHNVDVLYTKIVYDLSLYPGEPYYKICLMVTLNTSFAGIAVYDVHACLRECMIEVFGSDSMSDVEQIIQTRCRIDFGDPDDLWKEIFFLFDFKSSQIVSEIPIGAPCI